MNDEPSPTPSPTISISKRQLVVMLMLGCIFIAGDIYLPQMLGVDTACLDMRTTGRAAAMELMLCSADDGPAGWFYLAWFFAPIVLIGVWVRKMLKQGA